MKSRPHPGRAKVLLVEWVRLLQLRAHQGSMQGLDVEWVLVQLKAGRDWPGQAHIGKSQVGPNDAESA